MRPKIKLIVWLIILQLFLLVSAVLSIKTVLGVAAQTGGSTTSTNTAMWLALSSALAVGATGLAAGLTIKTAGTAAISLLSERPEQFFKAFLVVAFGEALAIYGLIVAILLWTKIV